jgi:hypothetical protein
VTAAPGPSALGKAGTPVAAAGSPSLSIVIPFVRPEGLALTLGSLARCGSIEQVQVIAVGDGVSASAGEHLDGANYPFDLTLRVVDRCGRIGKLRNIGATMARSNTLYFIDSDCMVGRDVIENILLVSGRDVAIGKIEFFGRSALSRVDASIRDARYGYNRQVAYCPNLLIKKDLFEYLGKFDERFRYGSDGEFAYRIQQSGTKVYYEPSILVRHDCTAPGCDIIRKWGKYGEGRFYRNRKHERSTGISDWFPNLFDLRKGFFYNAVFLASNVARTCGFLRGYLAVKRGRGLL